MKNTAELMAASTLMESYEIARTMSSFSKAQWQKAAEELIGKQACLKEKSLL